jgi:hypothetical protein
MVGISIRKNAGLSKKSNHVKNSSNIEFLNRWIKRISSSSKECSIGSSRFKEAMIMLHMLLVYLKRSKNEELLLKELFKRI